jgi:hypothetical protein
MAHATRGEGYTRHASVRLQQRAIPPLLIDFLLEFGVRAPAGSGAESYCFSKKGWRRLQRLLGPTAKHFDKYRDVFAVVSGDGLVITAAHSRGCAHSSSQLSPSRGAEDLRPSAIAY